MTVNEEGLIHTLLVAFDLAGTFVFALSGGMDGMKHRLDLFGVLVWVLSHHHRICVSAVCVSNWTSEVRGFLSGGREIDPICG